MKSDYVSDEDFAKLHFLKPLKNAIKEADQIINEQRDERDQQYGGFSESMGRSAQIASILIGRPVSTPEFFLMMIALKLGRLSFVLKHDTLVDLIGYTGGLSNYLRDNDINYK